MNTAHTTYAARRAARRTFIDICIIERPTLITDEAEAEDSEPVLDLETGQYVDPDSGDPIDVDKLPRTLVYRGPFRLQVRSDINSNAVEAVIGEHEDVYRTGSIELPVRTPTSAQGSTSAVLPGDMLTILRCKTDAAMQGRVLNMMGDVKGKTNASKRRFRTREVIA